MYYARINKNNECIATFGTNKKEVALDLVELGRDIDVIGKVWNGTSWEGEGLIIPEQEETISDAELIQAEILLTQQEILINQQNQDETLAAILLTQAGQIIESY